VTIFLGGPPALVLARSRRSPRSARAPPRLAPPRQEAPGDARAGASAPPRRQREFALTGRSRRRYGARGAVRDHYGYYSLRHDYPVFDVERSTGGATRSSRPRSRKPAQRTSSSATTCRSSSPRSSRSSCRASSTSGATGHGLPLPCRGGREGPLRPRGDLLRVPDPRRGAARADEVPPPHRRPRRPEDFRALLETVLAAAISRRTSSSSRTSRWTR